MVSEEWYSVGNKPCLPGPQWQVAKFAKYPGKSLAKLG